MTFVMTKIWVRLPLLKGVSGALGLSSRTVEQNTEVTFVLCVMCPFGQKSLACHKTLYINRREKTEA